MKLYEIPKEVFDDFPRKNHIRNFYQTSYYGDWMKRRGFNTLYLAMIDDKNIVYAQTLIIYKNVFGKYKYGYVPRGFLIDYYDENIFEKFTSLLKDYLKKNNFAYLKLDPAIINKSRDKSGNIIKYGKDSTKFIKKMESLGYKHCGFNLYFESLKPRWNAVIKLDKSEYDMYKSFNKDIRNKINNAKRKGLEVYKGTRDDIKIFYNLVKNNYNRPIDYYYDYYDIFKKKDMLDIYMVKVNTIKYLENSKKLYEQEIEKNNKYVEYIWKNANKTNKKIVNRKIESDKLITVYKNDIKIATQLLKNYPNGFIIASSMVIKYNKQAQFLIDGIDPAYKSFNPNHLLKWNVIKECINSKYYYIDLNGIVGNFKKTNNKYYGLNKFKLGFNSNVIEYVGEFDLPINYPIYKLVTKYRSR